MKKVMKRFKTQTYRSFITNWHLTFLSFFVTGSVVFSSPNDRMSTGGYLIRFFKKKKKRRGVARLRAVLFRHNRIWNVKRGRKRKKTKKAKGCSTTKETEIKTQNMGKKEKMKKELCEKETRTEWSNGSWSDGKISEWKTKWGSRFWQKFSLMVD